MMACNDGGQKKVQEQVPQPSDTIGLVEPGVKAPGSINLKEMEISTKTIIDNGKLSGSRLLNTNELMLLSIPSIDSTAGSRSVFRYHLVDTLFSGSNLKVLLIGREYTEENILWIASYDRSSALLDHVEVYYDNAEGNLSIGCIVKNNSISVSKENVYAANSREANKTEVYLFDERDRLVKHK